VENLGGRMRRMKKRGPHVLYDLNDLLFSLQVGQLYILRLQISYSVYLPNMMNIGWQLTKLLQK